MAGGCNRTLIATWNLRMLTRGSISIIKLDLCGSTFHLSSNDELTPNLTFWRRFCGHWLTLRCLVPVLAIVYHHLADLLPSPVLPQKKIQLKTQYLSTSRLQRIACFEFGKQREWKLIFVCFLFLSFPFQSRSYSGKNREISFSFCINKFLHKFGIMNDWWLFPIAKPWK